MRIWSKASRSAFDAHAIVIVSTVLPSRSSNTSMPTDSPPDGAGVANMGAVGANEGIVLSALDAADRERVLVAEPEAQFLRQLFDRGFCAELLLGGRQLGRPLTQRLCQRQGRIGGNGPRSHKILLVHHDASRLAPPGLPVMPILVAWFLEAVRHGEAI